jgi:hypothetical protein
VSRSPATEPTPSLAHPARGACPLPPPAAWGWVVPLRRPTLPLRGPGNLLHLLHHQEALHHPALDPQGLLFPHGGDAGAEGRGHQEL